MHEFVYMYIHVCIHGMCAQVCTCTCSNMCTCMQHVHVLHVRVGCVYVIVILSTLDLCVCVCVCMHITRVCVCVCVCVYKGIASSGGKEQINVVLANVRLIVVQHHSAGLSCMYVCVCVFVQVCVHLGTVCVSNSQNL